MVEKYIVQKDVIGSSCVETIDGGQLLTYTSVDGKHFIKSMDCFCTISDSWILPGENITAAANLIRLKDGRLMTTIKRISENEKAASLSGASFYAAFSDDEGRSFKDIVKINKEENAYFLMNNRLIRTKTGRILLPVCYMPNEFLSEEYFEKVGWVGCFYSDDEGKTWNESKYVKGETVDQLAEPMVAQGDDEALYMYMRTGMGYLYYSKSTDDGLTWEKETRSQLRSPCAPFCINYDKFEKRFLAVWDNSFPAKVHQHPRCPICIAESKDCVNWNMITELGNDPMKSYGYPMILCRENEIVITFYENPEREFDSKLHKLKLKIFKREELKNEFRKI